MTPSGGLWNGHRVPFTLLGGYLGAGKTTVVNHVVRNPLGRRLVALVNDVAAINVDAALIADHVGTTLSLTNGCVCCAIADDFAQTLEQIRAMPEPPDHVLMELSGVGEPARVAPWANTAGFRLDGIVVVADTDQIVELADRDYIGDTIAAQLASADLVLSTKADLAADGGAAARSLIRSITTAPIIEVINGVIDADVVLGLDPPRTDPSRTVLPRMVPGTNRHRAAPVGRYETSIVDVGAATLAELEHLLVGLPTDVIRAKGLVQCSDQVVPIEAHAVGRRRAVRRRGDLDLSRADNRLVVIRLA